MYKCEQCGLEKEVLEFYSTNTKLGHDKKCKICRLNNAKIKTQKAKPKKQKTEPVKYRKCKSLINPTKPIPIKITSENGFGGYYKFDITKLTNDQLKFAKQHGMKNHMVNRKFKCLQIKSNDEVSMIVFCDYIKMDRKAIVKFEKTDNTVYVVNLYHPNILQVVK